MPQHSNRENRELPSVSQLPFDWEWSANVSDGKADMHADGKSHGSMVPTKTANNGAAEAPAESDEGRDPAKRNAEPAVLSRTPGRNQRRSRGLHGVREATRKDSTLKFTALPHHVNEDCLSEAFFNLKQTAAVGVDKESATASHRQGQRGAQREKDEVGRRERRTRERNKRGILRRHKSPCDDRH